MINSLLCYYCSQLGRRGAVDRVGLVKYTAVRAFSQDIPTLTDVFISIQDTRWDYKL